jgi:hypothetical protein
LRGRDGKEKNEDDKEKEEEILKLSGLRRNVLLSIIVFIGWLIFLILWFVSYASDYIPSHYNRAIILLSILIMVAIFAISWASWAMKYCWKVKKDNEEVKWWQLGQIWFGFFIIIFVIAFGIAQPSLWYLFDKNPPNTVIETSNLLLIVITLLAVGLTGFSVLIYESLQERLRARVAEVEKDALTHIEKQVNKAIEKHQELSKRTEKEAEIRQTIFRTQMLRSLSNNYWQLFLVWEKVEAEKHPMTEQAKKISEKLIGLAIEKAKSSLDSSEKLPEQHKKHIDKSKNNWIYFLAEAARIEVFEPYRSDKKLALKFSDEILKNVCKEDYEGYFHCWETCAWAMQHLSGEEDESLKQEAHDIIHKLIIDRNIRPSWREEIRIKWERSWTQKGQNFHEDFNKKIEGA